MSSSAVISKKALFSNLDDLLDSIGAKLQISATRHEEVRKRYHAIAERQHAEDSSLAKSFFRLTENTSFEVCLQKFCKKNLTRESRIR